MELDGDGDLTETDAVEAGKCELETDWGKVDGEKYPETR